MNKTNYLLVASLLLVACAQFPQPGQPARPEKPAQPASSEKPATPEKPAQSTQPTAHAGVTSEPAPVLPHVALTNDVLYEYLLAEIAHQRGYDTLAMQSSSDLVRKTRDPRLAKRAAQFAFESGEMDKAIDAFRDWQTVEPESTVPTRMLASVLLRGGKLDEAQVEMAKVLKAETANRSRTFLQIFQLLATYPDKPAALKIMRDLAQPYPDVAEAHWSVAQLAQLARDDDLALNEVRQAHSQRPEWEAAIALEAQLLLKKSPQEGLDVLRKYLAAYPASRDIRLQYARSLLELKQYEESREQFRRLASDNPDNPDLDFAIALISMQMNDLADAEKQFKSALSKGKKDQDAVHFYLGQLSEAKGDDNEAIGHYRDVTDGQYQFSAQLRVAYLLNKQGKLEEAREFLHQVGAANDNHRVQLLLVESQFLRDANRQEDAYQVLLKGLVELPDNPDLLYDTAMLADKLGKPEVFEQMMRKLIELQPDHAQAYNALGYSLLERKERIPEAMQLVEKALQLAPDDAAIMDSVGWGYYRSGKLEESLKMLRRAYRGNPDPEIAAHLGEVLWMHGDKDEARKIWQDSLKINPDSVPLQTIIKKFIP